MWQPRRRGVSERCSVYYRSWNSTVQPSQRSVYIESGDFLGVITYLI